MDSRPPQTAIHNNCVYSLCSERKFNFDGSNRLWNGIGLMKYVSLALVSVVSLILPEEVRADPAVVEAVEARQFGSAWTFSVTLSHGDTGWDDYADGWRVTLEDGTLLGVRELLHPHVNEQPFTRTLTGIEIPDHVEEVFVEARTNLHGWGSARFGVPLNSD